MIPTIIFRTAFLPLSMRNLVTLSKLHVTGSELIALCKFPRQTVSRFEVF